jgi:hypothetical protein
MMYVRPLAPATLFAIAATMTLAAATDTRRALATDDPAPQETVPDSTEAPSTTVVVYEREPERMGEEELRDHLYYSEEGHVELRLEDARGKALQLGLGARYDRVEELAILATQSLSGRGDVTPRLDLMESFSTGLETWFYRVEFEQTLVPDRLHVLGAGFDEVSVFDDLQGRVGDGENTLAALFFREDFRHYLGREGVTLSLRGRKRDAVLSLSYTDQVQRALPVTTNGSIFRRRDSFRDNPPADGGRLRSWSVRLAHESVARRHWQALSHRGGWVYETSSLRTGSDFQYERWHARSIWTLAVGPEASFTLALRVGGVISGDLPRQSRFYLGGLGTLRGHDFAVLSGERMALSNLEYAFPIFGQVHSVIFVDLGSAWDRPHALGDVRPALDAGLAFQNRTGSFRVNLARDLRTEEAPLLVTVRLGQPF